MKTIVSLLTNHSLEIANSFLRTRQTVCVPSICKDWTILQAACKSTLTSQHPVPTPRWSPSGRQAHPVDLAMLACAAPAVAGQ